MNRTRIKICGFTRKADLQAAIDLGVDGIGLVFVPASPRFVSAEAARALLADVPPFVTRVGLFMDAEPQFVSDVLAQTRLDLLQFHGSESPQYCGQWSLPYVKAVPMGNMANPSGYMLQYPDARGFLLDSHALGEQGGSGKTFNWQRLASLDTRSLILAGGLTAENVAAVISEYAPFALDISSGVESAKGIKVAQKMQQLMAAVGVADLQKSKQK